MFLYLANVNANWIILSLLGRGNKGDMHFHSLGNEAFSIQS